MGVGRRDVAVKDRLVSRWSAKRGLTARYGTRTCRDTRERENGNQDDGGRSVALHALGFYHICHAAMRRPLVGKPHPVIASRRQMQLDRSERVDEANCGGFPDVFDNSELSPHGLLMSHARALEVKARLHEKHPHEPHADCHVWAIFPSDDHKGVSRE